MDRSYDFILDLFNRLDRSEPYRLDPSGDEALRIAKQVRRAAMRRSGVVHAAEEAVRHFGLPPATLPYAARLERPLYAVPARSSSS
jgi:hypothetical protein